MIEYLFLCGSDLHPVHDESFPIIDIGGSLSGISAAGTSFALPGTFNFNGAKYNISTGGVLPTIRDYAGPAQNSASEATRLSFAGGHVLTNTTFHLPCRRLGGELVGCPKEFLGLPARSYSKRHMYPATESQYQLNLTNVYSNFTMPSQVQAYNATAWDSTATVTEVLHPSNNMSRCQRAGSFLRSSVPASSTIPPIIPEVRYNFLPSTVCEVSPLLTTVRVNYSSEIIEASEIVESRAFNSSNSALLLFLAGIASYEAREAQGMLTNSIGDALISIYSATVNVTSPIENGTEQVYTELENYWRGAIEFSATFLRSGYSAAGSFSNDIIPSDLTTPINGTMWMLTMGWADRGALYLFSIVPLGLITLLTILTVVYSFTHFIWSLHVRLEARSQSRSRSSDEFTKEGLKKNEAVLLELQEDKDK
ncbi:hypothetical protein BU15DRAFT_61625 [Melanogaster broomeanus]|nr:hypothetical protein BU15DRAFT_61625 [Melanogaster broomeanus]